MTHRFLILASALLSLLCLSGTAHAQGASQVGPWDIRNLYGTQTLPTNASKEAGGNLDQIVITLASIENELSGGTCQQGPPGPAGPAGFNGVQYITVNSGQAIAKSVTLQTTPSTPSLVMLDIIKVGPQAYGLDFTVVGTTLQWGGLGLDGLVTAGDVFRILYPAANQAVEYRTVTSGENIAKQLTLANTPAMSQFTVVDFIKVGPQAYSTDFIVSGAILDWNGKGMQAVVSTGSLLRISYFH